MVFCVVTSWVNGQKYENFLQFNTSWLASLRTWYYFKFYFSSSCFGYDLTLIKKSHALNCYPFLQNFLLKTRTYRLELDSMLVTVVAQFTAETINSEKPIYFLSLMSCSMNRLKSHMLQVMQIQKIFRFYVEKIFFLLSY